MLIKKILFLLIVVLRITTCYSQPCSRLVKEDLKNYFTIILDKSGSMVEINALEQAQLGIKNLITSMKKNDLASIITFSDNVHIIQDHTSDVTSLFRAVDNVVPGGNTSLYDAIALAAKELSKKNGIKVIIYLTDGDDNSSVFSLEDIKKMNIGEGILVYGIGLGNINHSSLDSLSTATNGLYRRTISPNDFKSLYGNILEHHYENFYDEFYSSGTAIIKSIPSNRTVYLDNKYIGKTPLTITNINEGTHPVSILFKGRTWECNVVIKSGHKSIIEANENELSIHVWVSTIPGIAAIYFDDNYIGLTSMLNPSLEGDSSNYDNQLKISNVENGTHTIKAVIARDVNIGKTGKFEFEFKISDKSRAVTVDILTGIARFKNGEIIRKTMSIEDLSDSIPEFSF